VAVVLLAAAPLKVRANEPDGSVALRYEWVSAATADGTRPLRVAITAIVALHNVRVSAKIPDKTTVDIRALTVAGRAATDLLETRWPDVGLLVGDLGPGQTVVFELDVVEPSKGGGILGIGLDGLDRERPIHEGVGITVGTPGVVPTLRNDALEFPAEQGGRVP